MGLSIPSDRAGSRLRGPIGRANPRPANRPRCAPESPRARQAFDVGSPLRKHLAKPMTLQPEHRRTPWAPRRGTAVAVSLRVQRISPCMIARNGATMVANCVAFATGPLSEAVVVDTDRQDRAVAGARVRSLGRRHASSAAPDPSIAGSDRVLVLDAHEELAPGTVTAMTLYRAPPGRPGFPVPGASMPRRLQRFLTASKAGGSSGLEG